MLYFIEICYEKKNEKINIMWLLFFIFGWNILDCFRHPSIETIVPEILLVFIIVIVLYKDK